MIQHGVSLGDIASPNPDGNGAGPSTLSQTTQTHELTIGKVMDWIEARLDAIKSREEEEDEDEERESQKHAKTTATATTIPAGQKASVEPVVCLFLLFLFLFPPSFSRLRFPYRAGILSDFFFYRAPHCLDLPTRYDPTSIKTVGRTALGIELRRLDHPPLLPPLLPFSSNTHSRNNHVPLQP